jgi:hypothetical protein
MAWRDRTNLYVSHHKLYTRADVEFADIFPIVNPIHTILLRSHDMAMQAEMAIPTSSVAALRRVEDSSHPEPSKTMAMR